MFKNIFLKVSLDKGISMLVGFSYVDTGDFWVFNIHLLPINIQIYTGIVF
jgi:hypothetical protein